MCSGEKSTSPGTKEWGGGGGGGGARGRGGGGMSNDRPPYYYIFSGGGRDRFYTFLIICWGKISVQKLPFNKKKPI